MKNNIKIFIFLCTSIFLCHGSFAQEDSIDVSLSNTQIQMGENVQMKIQIDPQILENNEINIEIPGQENFQVFSQSQSTSFQNINGVAVSQSVFILDMRPLNTGKFSFGPVVIYSGSGTIKDDEIFNIEVTDMGVKKIQKNNTEILPQKEQIENTIRKNHSIQKPYLLIVLLLGIFIIVFYFILQLFFKKKEESNIQQRFPEIKEIFFQEMIQYFEELGKKSETLSSQKFFQVYNTALRKIFIYEGINNAYTTTLLQLEKDDIFRKHTLSDIFRKTYTYEYITRNTTYITRKKYIDTVLTYLKNIGNISL